MTKPVTIIGAGLAGLYCGYLLQQRKIEFTIVEASSRLGGRILCEPHSSQTKNQLKVDLGPAWFWPHQTEMMTLMKILQVEYFEQYNQGDALFEADAQSRVERFTPSYLESFRVLGGMQRLIDKLVNELPVDCVELNRAVNKIESINGVWQLNFDNHGNSVYSAERLIIAAPPRVIVDKLKMPDAVLQPLKNQLAKLPTWMAAQAKFVATYREPFWRERGLSGQAFSRQGPMVEIHDASGDEDNGFALFGFIGVPANDRKDISNEVLKQACLTQLAKIFGEHAMDIELSYLVDWANNEFIASDADLNEQPGHPHIDLRPYRQTLIDHRLYFAGSEVATLDPGYLRGALVAASHAVDAIISR